MKCSVKFWWNSGILGLKYPKRPGSAMYPKLIGILHVLLVINPNQSGVLFI